MAKILAEHSTPIRDNLEPDFGVVYTEDVTSGGKQDLVKDGKSFLDKPGRTMCREELESRQDDEHKKKFIQMVTPKTAQYDSLSHQPAEAGFFSVSTPLEKR